MKNDSLTEFVESNFQCSIGPAGSQFDVGEDMGISTRKLVYVCYAASS